MYVFFKTKEQAMLYRNGTEARRMLTQVNTQKLLKNQLFLI